MADAELVLGLCDRFHCLPSQLEHEPAEVIRLVAIQIMGKKRDEEGE